MAEKRRRLSIVNAPDERLLEIAKEIAGEFKDPTVDRLIVEFEEPVEEAMGVLAWPWPGKPDHFHPASPASLSVSDALCKYNVKVVGVKEACEPAPPTVSLIVGTYIDYRERSIELIECLERNVQNQAVIDIHLFIESPVKQWENWFRLGAWETGHKISLEAAPTGGGGRPEKYDALDRLDKLRKHPKIKLVPFGRQPFYREYFQYANSTFPKGRLVVVANSDMEFDSSLGLLNGYPFDGAFGCLARNKGMVIPGNIKAPSFSSADAWIFSTPFKELPSCDFPLGVRAGECLMAWEAASSGLILINPCLSIRATHRHASDVRRWPRFPMIFSRLSKIAAVSLEALKSNRFSRLRNRG